MRAESHKIICTNNVQTNGGPNGIVTDILGGGSGFSGIFFSIRNRGDITILTDVPGDFSRTLRHLCRRSFIELQTNKRD